MAVNHSTWHVQAVKGRAALAFAAIAALAAGCEQHVAGGSTNGSTVFQSICAACHGETGKPTAANVARLGVKDLTAPELRARITPALVENQVRRGSQNKLMPALEGALTEDQIKAVAAYVASDQFMLLSGKH
jgi:mono/diheme cytochrome c family protein